MRNQIDQLCAMAVMAKASAPGRTKTRLCPPLTPAEAAAMNTAFLQDIAVKLLATGAEHSVTGAMAYGPPGAASFFEENLPAGIDCYEAWFPNFGDCLIHALEVLLANERNTSAVVLNADSPTLPLSLLAETARVLSDPGAGVVLGPSTDGGYYLLGLRAVHRGLFQDITWSTDTVAEQTLERAKALGLEVHLLPAWYDVDDADALRTLVGELFEGRPFSPALSSSPAQRSAAVLASLFEKANLAERLGVDRPGSMNWSQAPRHRRSRSV